MNYHGSTRVHNATLKFQGHRSTDPGGESFTIFGHGGHVDHVTRIV